VTLRRLLIFAAVVLGLYFAIQGGEYSTTALIKQRTREEYLTQALDSLEREVDSLRALKKAIQSDPVTQERIAREDHGLVRGDREILYRFIDSTKAKP
jgi:cell division protein FtsB